MGICDRLRRWFFYPVRPISGGIRAALRYQSELERVYRD